MGVTCAGAARDSLRSFMMDSWERVKGLQGQSEGPAMEVRENPSFFFEQALLGRSEAFVTGDLASLARCVQCVKNS